MPKKESEQFGDSNHKGIFKKILNKLIIIRDYEKKLLIKNKSIASEGYYDSNDKLDEKISFLRGWDGIYTIFSRDGNILFCLLLSALFIFIGIYNYPYNYETGFVIAAFFLICAWIRFKILRRIQKIEIQRTN